MSTNPGVTRHPSASISREPVPSTRPFPAVPTATTTPSLTATSAVRAGAPVPSTPFPPRTTRSYSAIGAPHQVLADLPQPPGRIGVPGRSRGAALSHRPEVPDDGTLEVATGAILDAGRSGGVEDRGRPGPG